MAENFDPYYAWLGIPPADQPADHYRLLGLNRYEPNRQVIANAYDQRMAHIRTFQTGPNAASTQKILSDLSRAYTCLMNVRRKGMYDQHLKTTEKASQNQVAGWPPTEEEATRMAVIRTSKPVRIARRNKANTRVWVGGIVALLLVGAVVAITMSNRGGAPIDSAASADPPTVTVNRDSNVGQGGANSPIASDTKVDAPPTVPTERSPAELTRPVVPKTTMSPPTVPPKNVEPVANDSTPAPKAPVDDAFQPAVDSPSVRTAPSTSKFALQFSGLSRVELLRTKGLIELGKPFTLELWARFALGADAHWLSGDMAFGPNHPDVSGVKPAGWQLWIMKTEMERQRIAVASGKGFFTDFLVKENAWRHIAVCGDAAKLAIFVDGRLARSQSLTDPDGILANWIASPINLHIGGHAYLHPTQPVAFRGDVSGYRVSSVARYTENFTPAATLENDSDTEVYLDFSRDTGDSIVDLSGNRRLGRLTDTKWVSAANDAIAALPSSIPNMTSPLSVSSSSNMPSVTKRPVPGGDEIDKARDEVNSIFRDDRTKATDEKLKESLAQKLRDVAKENGDRPASQYALLDEARLLAVSAGDWILANDIIEDAERLFVFAGAQWKVTSYRKIADTTRTADSRKRHGAFGIELIDDLTHDGEFDAAEETAKTVAGLASKAKDPELSKAVRERRDELASLRKRWTAAHESAEQLKSSPDDPKLNEAWGLFLASQQEEWDRALPFLAKAENKELREVAELDLKLKQITDIEQPLAVAQKWSELASSIDKKDRVALFERSLQWYRRVEPNAKGLSRVQIEKRIQEVNSSIAANETKKGKRKPAAVTVPEPPPELRGLLGRMQIDGRDLGVLWRYETGLNITDPQVANILSQVGAPAGRVQMEFVGILFVPEATKVRFRLTGGTAKNGAGSLFVGNKKVGDVNAARDVRDQSDSIDLGSGEHPVRWVLTGTELGTSSINFTDSKSGKQLPVYLTQQLAIAVRDTPFVAKFNVQMERKP